MRPPISRRHLIAGGTCALCAGGAHARITPASMSPLIGEHYAPVDRDEKGLWQGLDRLEQDLAASNALFREPAVHAYTLGVMRNLLGDQMRDFRLYILHDPEMNASVMPNGAVTINTGLLIRMRNEAQYAAVLGHESGHYLRKHTLARFRDREAKTGAMAFIAAGAGLAAGAVYTAGGPYAGGNARGILDMANSINGGLAMSLFSFSREQEMEADAYGVKLMEQADYPPEAASEIWRQYIAERRSSAASLGKRYRDATLSTLSTHPPTDARMLDLADSARELETRNAIGRAYDDRRDAWRSMIAPFRSRLLEEQVKRNDAGASLYLIEALASDGWDGILHFWRGEALRLRDRPGDAAMAADSYRAAVARADAPAEAWRAQGYQLIGSGARDDGRKALTRYLELRPDAPDAAMVRFSLAQ